MTASQLQDGFVFYELSKLCNTQADYHSSFFKVAIHASELRIDPLKGLLLTGLSAGALIVEVVAQLAREDSVLRGMITGQILLSPLTCANGAGIFPAKY